MFEPRPGEQDPTLPRVVMIYQGDPVGAVVVTEGPATGQPGDGEPVSVGAHQGWLTAEGNPVLVWEQDGVRIELRGRQVAKEKLLEAAASMVPFAAPPSP